MLKVLVQVFERFVGASEQDGLSVKLIRIVRQLERTGSNGVGDAETERHCLVHSLLFNIPKDDRPVRGTAKGYNLVRFLLTES